MGTNNHADNRGGFGNAKKIGLVAFGFALSGLGLWFLFQDIDVHKLADSVNRIRILPLLASLVVYWCGGIVVRAVLIHWLLKPVGHVAVGKAYRYICIGFLANNLLPLRMGELVRIGGIARVSGIGIPSVTGGLAVERLLDLIMAVILCIIAAQVAPLPDAIRIVIITAGSLLVLAFVVFTVLARGNLKELPSTESNRLKRLLWNLLVRFSTGFKILASAKDTLRAVGLSALLWSFVVTATLFRLPAFGLPASLPVVIVLLSSIALGVSMPSAPGYVGVYHVAAAGALALFGVEEEVAVGYAIFSHLVDISGGVLFGMVSMVLEGMGWSDLKRTTIH